MNIVFFHPCAGYEKNQTYIGGVVGRCANRISGGNFNLDGNHIQLSTNDGPNHLHGGHSGFNKVSFGLKILIPWLVWFNVLFILLLHTQMQMILIICLRLNEKKYLTINIRSTLYCYSLVGLVLWFNVLLILLITSFVNNAYLWTFAPG